jgi:acetylornithine deacetylase/succinyl-diaminopimelate desuccinylase-like protein
LRKHKRDQKEVFDAKERHAEYWQAHNYDVMLVIRTSDEEIRWMNATEYLKEHGKDTRQIVFNGEPFTALNGLKIRKKLFQQK